MKNFFKRFGVVFLAVMFLFCSSVSVFAEEAPPDQTDQTETTAVESSAAEGSAIQVVTDGEGELSELIGYFYVPSGWTCEAGTFPASLDVSFVCDFDFFNSSRSFEEAFYFLVGYEFTEDSEFVEKSDSIVVAAGFTLDSLDYINVTPDSDFLIALYDIEANYALVDFFDREAIPLFTNEVFNEDFLFGTYSIPSGWNVNAGYYHNEEEAFSLYLNDEAYENYFIAMGYTVSDGALVEAADSIVIYKDSLDDAIQLTSEDAFTLEEVGMFPFMYFKLHNGTLVPPTLMESVLDIFLSVGEWISGAVSALIPLFWDSSAGALTFVGVLSVSGLAFSVSMLLISLISKFLRFGG